MADSADQQMSRWRGGIKSLAITSGNIISANLQEMSLTLVKVSKIKSKHLAILRSWREGIKNCPITSDNILSANLQESIWTSSQAETINPWPTHWLSQKKGNSVKTGETIDVKCLAPKLLLFEGCCAFFSKPQKRWLFAVEFFQFI